jgi:hypothetical protein
MALLHFVLMFVLMYAMVDRITYVYPNMNQVYMAALMTSLCFFWKSSSWETCTETGQSSSLIAAVSVAIFMVSFVFIRLQAGINDGEFLRSMISHHSGAILMCREASLTDPEVRSLCTRIIRSQQEEINQMRTMLERLGSAK